MKVELFALIFLVCSLSIALIDSIPHKDIIASLRIRELISGHAMDEVKTHYQQQYMHVESAKISHRNDLKRHGRAPASAMHTTVIAIQQNNVHKVKQLLEEVSDPFSSSYGNYLTFEEIGDLVRNDESIEHVERFLQYHHIEVLSKTPFREYITVRAPISKWEEILNTEFHEFEVVHADHAAATVKIHRALHYALPKYLRGHVSAGDLIIHIHCISLSFDP